MPTPAMGSEGDVPTPRISDAVNDAIRADRAAGLKVREIARRHGVSVGYVSELTRKDRPPELTEDEKAARRHHILTERDALKAVEGEKSFRAFLTKLFRESMTPFDPPPVARPPKSKGRHVRHVYLHLSDWHGEEIVKPDGVLGLNEYSFEICCRRVYRVIHSFLAWHHDQTAIGRYVIPKLTIGLNGDFLSGVLHGLERHSSAPNIIRATIGMGRLIALAIRDLAAAFPQVEVVATVGNHGRLPDDKKVPTKDPTRSFDYMAYALAHAYLANVANIQWTIPDAYGALFEVGGHLCFQGHGNFIRQQLSIVGYGMRRFTSNLASNLQAAGRPLKYAFFGHFHAKNLAEFAGVEAFIGPSLVGTQEYGFLEGGSVNRPAQIAHVFDRDLGHVEFQTFYGDGKDFAGAYEVGFDA